MKILFFLLVLLSFITSTNSQDFWEPTNGPYGALITCISMNSNGDLFAGSRDHGLFRSTNDAANWTPVNNGLNNHRIYSLAINSNGYLFTGTRDGYGMFRSTDNGENWTAINNGLTNTEITYCAINSQDHIFAGSAEGSGGLFRSIDNGDSWTQIGFQDQAVFRIEFDNNNNVFVSTLGDGIFRSTDNGHNWESINNGLTNLTVAGIGFNSEGHMFIGTFDGIFRSTDSGSNWTLVDSNFLPLSFALNSKGDFFGISYMNPGYGMVRSIDDGNIWTEVTMDLDAGVMLIAENDDIFVGTISGIYSSFDDGETFSKTSKGILCGVLSFCTNSSNHLFAGSDEIGVFRSEDNGQSWNYINNGFAPGKETRSVFDLCINSIGYIFTGSNRGVYCSVDNGDNWFSCNNGLEGYVNSLVINSDDILFTGTDEGVFRSDDNGNNWREKNSGITDNSPVHTFAVNSTDDIFASTYERFYRSTDNGNSWTQIHDNQFDCIVFNSSGHIYAGTDFSGIHLSTDNGDTWIGVSDIPTTSLIINSLDHIFAGNESTGVYRSMDNGETWEQINSGLTNTKILSLALDNEDYILAGTSGGVFRSLSTTTAVKVSELGIPETFSLKQNYPNPFNPTTKIRYALPENSYVKLRIYDILGNLVLDAIDGDKSAGYHEFTFDASELSSGVYIYKLRAGEYVDSKKMIVLR